MSRAQAGHGTLIAMELTVPAVFTTFAELNGDIEFPGINRPETEITPHNDGIDSWSLGVMHRDALKFSVNFIFDDETHDYSSGAYGKLQSNAFVGFRVRGPGVTVGGIGADEWIASGQVQSVMQKAPVRQGVRTADVTVRLSGPMIIAGAQFGGSVT